MSRTWGVWYPDTLAMDINDEPFVEEADDQRDAETWRSASGDPTARVVYSYDDGQTWNVATQRSVAGPAEVTQ